MKLKDDDFWKPLIAPIEVIEGKEPILQVTLDEEGDEHVTALKWNGNGFTPSR